MSMFIRNLLGVVAMMNKTAFLNENIESIVKITIGIKKA